MIEYFGSVRMRIRLMEEMRRTPATKKNGRFVSEEIQMALKKCEANIRASSKRVANI